MGNYGIFHYQPLLILNILHFHYFSHKILCQFLKDNISRLLCKQKIEILFSQEDFIVANFVKGLAVLLKKKKCPVVSKSLNPDTVTATCICSTTHQNWLYPNVFVCFFVVFFLGHSGDFFFFLSPYNRDK